MECAKFIFYLDSEEDVNVIVKSLLPEIKHKIPKTDVKITSSGKKLCLKIETDDISSLRAACNSYLRWVGTALNVKKTV